MRMLCYVMKSTYLSLVNTWNSFEPWNAKCLLKYGHLAIKMLLCAGIRWPWYTRVISQHISASNNSPRLCPIVWAGGLAKSAWTDKSFNKVRASYWPSKDFKMSEGQSIKCSRKHRPWSEPLKCLLLPISFFLKVAKP